MESASRKACGPPLDEVRDTLGEILAADTFDHLGSGKRHGLAERLVRRLPELPFHETHRGGDTSADSILASACASVSSWSAATTQSTRSMPSAKQRMLDVSNYAEHPAVPGLALLRSALKRWPGAYAP